jgi:predicted lipoprotein with Yx(FWY)xxD motif
MRLRYLLLTGIALLLTSALDSCSKSSGYGGSNTPPPVTPAVSFQIKTDSHFGSIIADGNGNTLYFFSLDANGSSACTGACLSLWPVSYAASPKFGTGLTASDFSSTTRTDGTKQTTYKGWPLYTYTGDATAGAVHGDGIENVFFVAKPDYTVMLANIQLVGNDGVKYDSTYKPGTGITQYLTDDRGVTLYRFSHDVADSNKFTKSDFSNDSFFPIVQETSTQNVPSTIDKSVLGTITVFGKTQLTFKGWPVYRFGADSLVRGNTRGISVPTPGVWPLMGAYSPAAP